MLREDHECPQNEKTFLVRKAISKGIPGGFGGWVSAETEALRGEIEGESPGLSPALPFRYPAAQRAVCDYNYGIEFGESLFICHTY